MCDIELLAYQLDRIKRHEHATGAKLFMGTPERWYDEGPLWWCTEGHVSRRYLKTETRGDQCLACHRPLLLTFPEDKDGPLRHVALGEQRGRACHR